MTRWTDVPRLSGPRLAAAALPEIGVLVDVNIANPGAHSCLGRAQWDGERWRHKSGNLVLGTVLQWSLRPGNDSA